VVAEEARLVYVAATRARDRLAITGPEAVPNSYLQWLAAGADRTVVSPHTRAAELMPVPPAPAVSLAWLDRLEPAPLPALAGPLTEPPLRYLTSATELMTRESDPELWELRYRHGVEPARAFAPEATAGEVSARLRGTVIHGVLERFPPGPLEQAALEEELAALLDEVVGELDTPELEPVLLRGHAYRAALEQEIARVVSGEAWRHLTGGEHYRELRFIHLALRREVRFGAFDLHRPGAGRRRDRRFQDAPDRRVAGAAGRRGLRPAGPHLPRGRRGPVPGSGAAVLHGAGGDGGGGGWVRWVSHAGGRFGRDGWTDWK
jgi:hypothetical protein